MKKTYVSPELDVTLFEKDIFTDEYASGPDEGNIDLD